MEGIVAKPKESPYRLINGKTTWIKVKNPAYSQAVGREEGRSGTDDLVETSFLCGV